MKKKIGDLTDIEKENFCKSQILCSFCICLIKGKRYRCKVFSGLEGYKDEEIEVQE